MEKVEKEFGGTFRQSSCRIKGLWGIWIEFGGAEDDFLLSHSSSPLLIPFLFSISYRLFSWTLWSARVSYLAVLTKLLVAVLKGGKYRREDTTSSRVEQAKKGKNRAGKRWRHVLIWRKRKGVAQRIWNWNKDAGRFIIQKFHCHQAVHYDVAFKLCTLR